MHCPGTAPQTFVQHSDLTLFVWLSDQDEKKNKDWPVIRYKIKHATKSFCFPSVLYHILGRHLGFIKEYNLKILKEYNNFIQCQLRYLKNVSKDKLVNNVEPENCKSITYNQYSFKVCKSNCNHIDGKFQLFLWGGSNKLFVVFQKLMLH